jgi:hypothetical protein
MNLRTYYWDQRNASYYKYYKNKIRNPERFYFKKGNMGDIFNIDLIKYIYKVDPINIKDSNNRLLLVGSIASKVRYGDIINGIGWKGNNLDEKTDIISSLKVFGVRGPLTKTLFEKKGSDLSNLKFELDPGLLIKEVYNIDLKSSKEKNVLFIPHYMDEEVYKGNYPKGIDVVSVDSSPKKIAKKILNAKIIYTSSLHGIIFSHALKKPCVFIKPQSNEPMFKYEDYFLSVGLDFIDPIKDIFSLNFTLDKPSFLNKKIGIDNFYFPNKELLIDSKILL